MMIVFTDNTRPVVFTNEQSRLQGELIHTQLTKSSRGFGFSIVGAEHTREELLQINRIIPGGAADVDGKLKSGQYR